MEILKVTLKKEFCDCVNSGSKNFFYFEPKNFWIKRFAIDTTKTFNELKGEKEFKKYDIVEVSCFGGEKFTYNFVGISTGTENDDSDSPVEEHTGFRVYVHLDSDESSETSENKTEVEEAIVDEVPVVPEQENEIEEAIVADNTEEVSYVLYDKVSDENDEVTGTDDTSEVFDKVFDENDEVTCTLEERIKNLFDMISVCDNIYMVNVPNVIITESGNILGTNKYVKNIRVEGTLKFGLGSEKIEYDVDTDDEFMTKIGEYLYNLVTGGNILFIFKNGIKLIEREDGSKYLKIIMAIKKKNRR